MNANGRSRVHRLTFWLVLLSGLACSAPWTPLPTQGNGPGGSCNGVNILDGIDESDPTEFLRLFDCLDSQGSFAAWRPLVEAVSLGRDASGTSLSVHAARLFNAGMRQLDPATSLRALEGVFREEPALSEELVKSVAEWVYADSWSTIALLAEEDEGELWNPDRLGDGQARILLELLLAAAASVPADRAAEWVETLAWVLEQPQTWAALGELALLIDDEDTSPLFDRYSQQVGGFLRQSASRYGPPGESPIWPLLTALSADNEGQLGIEYLLPSVGLMLASDTLVERLQSILTAQYDGGLLVDLPVGLHYLATTPSPLGQSTAMRDLLWLFAELDVSCALDLSLFCDSQPGETLSHDILTCLADLSAGTGTVSVLADMASWLPGLVGGSVDLLCREVDGPGVRQRVWSLGALADSPEVLRAVLPVLYALPARDGSLDGLRPTLNLLGQARRQDMNEPIADVLAAVTDPGAGHLDDLMLLIGAYISSDPTQRAFDPARSLELARLLVTEPYEGGGAVQEAPVVPLLRPLGVILDQAGSWPDRFLLEFADLLDPAGASPSRAESSSSRFIYLFAGLLSIEAEMELTPLLASFLRDPDVVPALVALASDPGVREALLDLGEGPAVRRDVPLTFVGRISSSGAVLLLLDLLTVVLELITGNDLSE